MGVLIFFLVIIIIAQTVTPYIDAYYHEALLRVYFCYDFHFVYEKTEIIT